MGKAEIASLKPISTKKDGSRYLYEVEPGRFVTRQRVYQLRRKIAGLCTQCGQKSSTPRKCDPCQAARRAYQNRKHAERKAS